MTHKIVITINVTDQQVNDIMSSAMQGIAHWADKAEPSSKDYEGYTSDALTAKTGQAGIRIHERDENKWHSLTIGKFLKALKKYNDFDFENYDMYDADNVVQLAIFGEVIYG